MIAATSTNLIGGGILALLASGGLAFLAWRSRRILQAIEATPTTPIGRIKLPGYYEVKGKVLCDNPLSTDEVQDVVHDSDGHHRTRNHTEVVEDKEESCTFQLQDKTGTLGVLPTGATFEGSEALKSREGRTDSAWKAERAAAMGRHAREHKGSRTTVTSIPVGRQVYAIGAVQSLRNGLFLQRDEAEGRPFLVSVKSESELVDSYGRGATWTLAGAFGCLLLGLGLIVAGLVGR
ncbi:MAG: hypothetical protein FD129_1030 [bacterium]|nr:MAG: hypothetical protein FD129_1030 [bacterium]